MRLSYTNPVTGRRTSRDEARQYVEVDGVVLEVEHTYRNRGLWIARTYFAHVEPRAAIEWIKADGQVFLFAHRRRDLTAKLAEYVTTEEWRRKRAAWLQLPKDPSCPVFSAPPAAWPPPCTPAGPW